MAISYVVTDLSATFSVILNTVKYPHHCNSAVVNSVDSISSQEVVRKPLLVRFFLYLQRIWAPYMFYCDFGGTRGGRRLIYKLPSLWTQSASQESQSSRTYLTLQGCFFFLQIMEMSFVVIWSDKSGKAEVHFSLEFSFKKGIKYSKCYGKLFVK